MLPRMEKEFKEINANCPEFITVEKSQNDALIWYLNITGPKDSCYEGQKYRVEAKFLPNYPFKMPEFRFLTEIFHPDVEEGTGMIC